MAEIRPFRALHYEPDVVGDFAGVVAPPYDVIDDVQRDALYARSPYNVVRLILGREADRYAAAAHCLAEWRAAGALVRDGEPALYVYVQDFRLPDGDLRQRGGIIGAVRLEPFSTGRIRPHERTLSGPKADRMRLMEACRVNLSPIFGLYAGRSAAVEKAREECDRTPPLVDIRDGEEVRHRLWRISPADATAIAAELEPQTIFIADGHHRYETALEYRNRQAERRQLSSDDPANFIMMFLCSMADPGLVVLPTHRVLVGLAAFRPSDFVASLHPDFQVRALADTELLAALHAAEPPGHLGIVARGAGAAWLASLSSPAVLDRDVADLVPAVRHLDVTLLDRLVLQKRLGVDAAAAAHDGRLRYVKDENEAVAMVRHGEADAAFLLKATRIDEVEAVCLSGETMPEKSTYFYPKLISGLLFNPLEDE